MLKPTGFWSYSTTDDEHSRGRLSRLRALLAAELQQKIGRSQKVNIFQDVAATPPGRAWEKQIRYALASSYFLIPIITPAMLQSEWCCREINLFREREVVLGRDDLIFPFHYLSVEHINPSSRDDCHDPKVYALLRGRQWLDFYRLRLKDLESEEVALKLEEMADAICAALRSTEAAPLVASTEIKPQSPYRKVDAKLGDDPVMADYDEAIRLDPSYASAFFNRGYAWEKKGDLDRAIADYDEAIRLDPSYVLAYFFRGSAWHWKGDLNRAIADYDEAIRLDPSYASAYFQRGYVWEKKGDLDRAIADYDEAIRLDPKDATAYRFRADAKTKKRDRAQS
jgi:tetratricopeptide (TPR) repeat protein